MEYICKADSRDMIWMIMTRTRLIITIMRTLVEQSDMVDGTSN